MPTKEERREIAAMLRDHKSIYISSCELSKHLGIDCTKYEYCTECKDASASRLADLIEPEPERTCRVKKSYYDELLEEEYTDLSCGHHVRGAAREFLFCPTCGAKVVE